MAGAKPRALDIFDLLAKLDSKDLHLWEKLSDEQKKEFSPLVVLKWMRGTTDADQLSLLNDLVNPVVFPLGQEKEFLMKLMAVCTVGGRKRYAWLASKAARKDKLKLKLIAEYNKFSLEKAEEVQILYSIDEIMQMAEELGWQKDEIAALKKELA